MKLNNINFIDELILTFSARKSLFSSKKMERFVVFIVFLSITVAYLVVHIRTMPALEFVEVCALWLGYAGYNSFMNLRDKKMNNDQLNKVNSDQQENQSESTSGEES